MKLISLFSGILGLDLGFMEEGFEHRLALDIYPPAVQTIRANFPGLPVINRDIYTVTTDEILEAAGLRPGEADVLTGGPPCQPFSTAGKREGINGRKGQLVFEYLRVVREARPKVFVFENVSGLVSQAERHISFYERASKREEELGREERLGSAFERIYGEFKGTGYALNMGVLNAADYGAPQKRKRLIIIGARDGPPVPLPQPTHYPPSRSTSAWQRPWVTLREALAGLPRKMEYTPLPEWGKYMEYVPPGGCWRDIPPGLQEKAMKGAICSQGGRTGYFRRLAWDEPAPTLVTSPAMKATALIHPEEDRPLSVEEYKRIQGFPDGYVLVGSTQVKYRLLGEAVPVQLSRALARAVKGHLEGRACVAAVPSAARA
ncbi:MAG: DNA cytosine methyltransferase [Candidatus Methanosuratincola petrocarbonis]|nr:DNA cytosine methyltransferase [Synergistales bacterium]